MCATSPRLPPHPFPPPPPPRQVDRAYIGAPDTLKVSDSGRGSVIMVHKRGFRDAVVWNPAQAKVGRAVHARGAGPGLRGNGVRAPPRLLASQQCGRAGAAERGSSCDRRVGLTSGTQPRAAGWASALACVCGASLKLAMLPPSHARLLLPGLVHPSRQAEGMADLGEHWRGFVCLEVAQARSGPVVLQAGEAWEGSTTVEHDYIGEGAD